MFIILTINKNMNDNYAEIMEELNNIFSQHYYACI